MKYLSSKHTKLYHYILLLSLVVGAFFIIQMILQFIIDDEWAYAFPFSVIFLFLFVYLLGILLKIRTISYDGSDVYVSGKIYHFKNDAKVFRVMFLPYIFYVESDAKRIYFIPSIADLFRSFPEYPESVKIMMQLLNQNKKNV